MMMQAVRFHQYGGPDVLRVEPMDVPQPAPNEVLVRVHGSSLNPADIGGRQGITRLVHARTLPHTPGYDLAGVVEACGAAVTAFVPGERVFALVGLGGGAQAEYACVAQEKLAVAPAGVDLTTAATAPLAALTALQGLRRAGRLIPGSRLLVNGASGGVGSYAVQIGRLLGCRVTGVCSADKAGQVRELGADEVIDYRREEFTERPQTWDLIFDAAGGADLRAARKVIAPGGAMVTTRPSPAGLLSAALGSLGPHPRYAWFITRSSGQDLALIARLLESGRLRAPVDRVFPMGAIQEANRYFESGQARGKVAVQIQPAGV